MWNNWIITSNDKMIFNIPIRTIEYRHQQAIYGVGAGLRLTLIQMMKSKNFMIRQGYWRDYNVLI